MKKADIYFNGQFICTVSFERYDVKFQEGMTALTIGFGDDKRVVALIPNTHLIVV